VRLKEGEGDEQRGKVRELDLRRDDGREESAREDEVPNHQNLRFANSSACVALNVSELTTGDLMYVTGCGEDH
jgi:hypothetical protein